MSKIDDWTDEILYSLKPFDFEHNRRHIRLVVGRMIGDDTVTQEKRDKFQKYMEVMERTRQKELPPTEGTPYRINIIDHRTEHDLVEDKPFIVDIYEGLVELCKWIKTKLSKK